MPIPGRELKALEVFAASMAFWAEQQKAGKVEAVRTYGPLTGDLEHRSALIVVEGTDAQIEALRRSEEYRVLVAQVAAIAQHLAINEFETGDRMNARMMRFGKEVKKTLG
jgi:hypothetical protein